MPDTKDETRQRDGHSYMTLLMTPDMVNFSGNIHGGALLKLLDLAAYACASHYSQQYVVTLSVDQVQFYEPVYVGELVTFKSRINYVGNSSMEVGVEVWAENIHTGEERFTSNCFITMIAVGDDGRPVKIQPLKLVTIQHKAQFVEARLRKQLRAEHGRRLADLHEKWSDHVEDLTQEEIEMELDRAMTEA